MRREKKHQYSLLWLIYPSIFWIITSFLSGCQSKDNNLTIFDQELISKPTVEKGMNSPGTNHTPDENLITPMYMGTVSIPDDSFTPNMVLVEATPVENNKSIDEWIICSPLASIELENLQDVVSAPYAPPLPGSDERHHGVDFAYYRRNGRLSIAGDEIQAVLYGKIAAVIVDRYPYGNGLIVESTTHNFPVDLIRYLDLKDHESLYLMYAHIQDAPTYTVGDIVNQCQGLGLVGSSGNAGAAHLHLEVRIGPSNYEFSSMANYISSASKEEREMYKQWRTSGMFTHIDPFILLLWEFNPNEIQYSSP